MTDLVAGVDSSTQSTKVELRELDNGAVVARATAPHPPTTPPVSEQDPEAWWAALVECFGQLDAADRARVAAISVGGQQHGLVTLDSDGQVVRPAKLWNDTTSAPQAERLVAERDASWWAQRCGSVPVAAFTITKLAWLAEHEPEAVDRVATVLLPHDYLTWRMTGRAVTDRGDASGTGWFAPASADYDPELLATVGAIGLDALPTVLGPTEVAGEVTDPSALGLRKGVVVGPGSGDNMAAALGLGLGAGDVAISLGTSGTIYGVSDGPTADPTGFVAGFADATGRYLPLVCTLNATKVTDTVATWLGTDAPGLAALALSAEGKDDGPVLVPYFDGERTPNLPDATGTFAGLRTDTTPPDLALAAHDGVVCGLLDGLDALIGAGVAADGRLFLVGGGARSEAYRQRAATLTQQPVIVPDDDETVATGAAVQAAAVVSGQALEDITSAWGLGRGTTIEPGRAMPSVRERYRRFSA